MAKELFRVTKEGGVVVWVVGDATINGSETGTSFRQALYFMECGFNLHDTMIYEKKNPIPTANNRYNSSFEYMFIFTKGKTKQFNLIRGEFKKSTVERAKYSTSVGGFRKEDGSYQKRANYMSDNKPILNNIWKYGVGYLISSKDAEAFQHPATYPEKLAEDHIISWSNPGDLILDPFMGSGTTAKMALKNQRNFIGFEISQEYVDLANQRIKGWKEQKRLF